MANYTSSENNILGSSYYSGVINPFEDYIIIPVNENKSVMVQGDITYSGGGEYYFEGDEVIVTRNTSGYTSTYEAETRFDQTGYISIVNDYFARGNVGYLSAVDTYRSEPAANFAVISLVWGVLFCVVLSSLLRYRSRRV